MINRPASFDTIIGQERVVDRLKTYSSFFLSTGGQPEPILLNEVDGMGKSALAAALACELQATFKEVESSALETLGGLTALLTNLAPRQVLLLKNIQNLKKIHVATLQEVLGKGKLTITIGAGPSARNHVLETPPFTLVATCPKRSDCPRELQKHFSLILEVEPYSIGDLSAIAEDIAKTIGTSFSSGAAELIARSCDGTPGHLRTMIERLVRSINRNPITSDDLSQAFAAFGINLRSPSQAVGIDTIQSLSGREFESLVTTMLARMGFRAEMTQATGDGGIDIIAIFDKPIFGGRYLFQCKRFASDNLIGSPTIRDFYGAVTADRAVKGIFITTSDFTQQAREFAERVGIELLNATELYKLLAAHELIC